MLRKKLEKLKEKDVKKTKNIEKQERKIITIERDEIDVL